MQTLACLADPNFLIPYPNRESLPTLLLELLESCLNRDPTKRPTIQQLLVHPFLHPDLSKAHATTVHQNIVPRVQEQQQIPKPRVQIPQNIVSKDQATQQRSHPVGPR